MHRAVEITVEIGVIVYDSLFLALAEVGAGILVTADERTILNRIKVEQRGHRNAEAALGKLAFGLPPDAVGDALYYHSAGLLASG